MPGVPTSRGCEACRKQRKKCDQAQPSCSRCARLRIECTGAGVRRFIFVDKMGTTITKKQVKRSRPSHPASAKSSYQVVQPRQAIYSLSPNSNDSLVALMINKLATKDLRYDIEWAYGSFMSDVPKRLGHSTALDAATKALTLALPPSPQARRHASMGVLHSYTVALKATRLALADRAQARSANTMCAVYFLLLCQDRVGTLDDIYIHVGGITHMLNDPESDFDPGDSFEAGLVIVLCSVMSGEMLLNTDIEASDSSRCWSFYNMSMAQSTGPPRPWASPDLTLASELSTLVSGLSSLLHTTRSPSEALEYYANLSCVARSHRTRLAEIRPVDSLRTTFSSRGEETPDDIRSYLRLLRSYGLTLTLGLIMNIILRIYYPRKTDDLAQTSLHFISELVSLATEAAHFKPLGSYFLRPFLHTAWAIGDDTSRRDLQTVLALNQVDFEVDRAMLLLEKLNPVFEGLRGRIAKCSPNGSSVSTSPERLL